VKETLFPSPVEVDENGVIKNGHARYSTWKNVSDDWRPGRCDRCGKRSILKREGAEEICATGCKSGGEK
jgi:hypothetical protein